jgi:tetratricopeptide (TPR) repeat protein
VYAKNGNLQETKQLLLTEFKKDTSRFDILQDIGKVSYYLGEYDSAFKYYKRFNRIRETLKLDVYQHENMLIGIVYEKMGQPAKAKEFMDSYVRYLETDQTAYKNLGLTMVYCRTGDSQKALEHLKLFAQEDNIQYWIILFLDKDPTLTATESLPEFKKLNRDIERKFWVNHEKLKLTLEEKGLM